MTIKDGGIAELDRIAECVTELESALDAIRKTTVKASKAFATRLAADEQGAGISTFGKALEHIGDAQADLRAAVWSLENFAEYRGKTEADG